MILKKLFYILFIIIIVELLFESNKTSFSGDIKHIENIENIINEKNNYRYNNVFFLGNSLIGESVDTEILNYNIYDYKFIKIVPDDTSIFDWYFISKNYIIKSNNLPSVLFIGFAWDELSDTSNIDPSRLGAHFCVADDVLLLSEFSENKIGVFVEFFMSKIFSTFANRNRIKKKLLNKIIVDYENYVKLKNEQKILSLDYNKDNNYEILKKLINLLKTNNIEPHFIAMPVINKYNIDKKLLKILKHNNVVLHDYRHLYFLKKSDYKDLIHLNELGKEKFTNHIINEILNINNQKYNNYMSY